MDLQRSREESKSKNNDVSEDCQRIQESLSREQIKEYKKLVLDNADITLKTLQTGIIELEQLQDEILRMKANLNCAQQKLKKLSNRELMEFVRKLDSLKERETEFNTRFLISIKKVWKLDDLIESVFMEKVKVLSEAENLEDKLDELKVDRELLMKCVKAIEKIENYTGESADATYREDESE